MTRATETSPEELAVIAVEIAEEAARHVRRRRPELFPHSGHTGEASSVSTKSTPTDPVTVADTESELLIRELLRARRPDDAVLGEEAGGSDVVPAGVRWVVDPIDGTVNFLYGIPAYAVSVAAQVDGVSHAGAVVDVARGVTYWAAVGGGAWSRGAGDQAPRRLRANPVDDVALALVATGFGYSPERRRAQGAVLAELLPRIRDVRRVGAAALDLCMVASGAVDVHFEHGLSPWDWAAGALIAAEAGAHVRIPPAASRAIDGYPTVAAAPGIAEEFLALLTEVGGMERLPG
ncbi:MAG: inositol monophosphatase family protein [Gordonia sp. (in: high G+C Gram-positive bacteria)]|uniref:inositol monophosphatase family protein n=1 Tax=Gordonia sp. (in: high G+C Gram-positive bacteria) TaxID=84139 RepID=UPI0039E2D120